MAVDWDALEREHQESITEIFRANSDLAERIAALGVTTDYNDALDIFFMEIGPPIEAVMESIDDNIGLRVEPDSLKVVGMEILNFKASLGRNVVLATIMLTVMALQNARVQGQATGVEEATVRLAENIRELLAA